MPDTANPIPQLARLVRESGLTQRAVAKRAGMGPNTLSRMLRGDYMPSAIAVGRVLAAIGRPWADLDRCDRSVAD